MAAEGAKRNFEILNEVWQRIDKGCKEHEPMPQTAEEEFL